MTAEVDDFEEICKPGLARVPCTVVCRESRAARGSGTYKRVSITFRTGLLSPEVVSVLRGARFSVAYSPSMRAFRVTAEDRGQFELVRAPRAEDVFLLRMPWSERMPWIGARVPASVDANEAQRAVFVEPQDGVAPAVLQQLPPREAFPRLVAPAQGAPRGRVAVPLLLAGVRLREEEADLLTVLSAEGRYTRKELAAAMRAAGHGSVSVAGLLARIRGHREATGLEVVTDDGNEDPDQRTAWLSPQGHARLRELVTHSANSAGHRA